VFIDQTLMIETERKKLLHSLDFHFEKVTLLTLSDIAEDLEEVLINFTYKSLTRQAQLICNCLQYTSDGYLVNPENDFFGLSIVPDVNKPGILLFSLNPRSPNYPIKRIQRTEKIIGYGKVKKN